MTSSRTPPAPDRPLRIVVVNPIVEHGVHADVALAAQARRGNALRIGLLESGFDIVASLPADLYLPERIAQLQPDLIIIDAESDARDVLEHIVIATRDERRPIVLFTEDGATASIDAAMAAGVSAYIVAGLQAERIQPVLNVALARFRQEEKLRAELLDTRHKLQERKVIERAKGLLMTHHGLTEEQAYQRLRSMAMNKKLKLADIAQRILDVEDLLG
ncbi:MULTISPECIES: ANTAR domain-containing response regulator [unclassified Janthinobacterium]|uniref:ANTAR domain-containing response regulator n=1 Tax=unclassified Janthinobacterium TaxID=2610881 RepID=UPI0008F4F4C0|nr:MULTISPECIES: ANTAR domain-containing protein [unclassified Janthinobacterium]APA68959.1 response regulator [Janthinobacterium sp. 1_2014MBL_MicDiv]MDN2710829.1 ANTAR domain-containing protein [Janthinobacterium sp. SUN118]